MRIHADPDSENGGKNRRKSSEVTTTLRNPNSLGVKETWSPDQSRQYSYILNHIRTAPRYFGSVWRIQNVFMRIPIPLFMLMWIRIRIQNFSARKEKKIFFKSSLIFFNILPNLSCVIFSVTMREEGSGVRDEEIGVRGIL